MLSNLFQDIPGLVSFLTERATQQSDPYFLIPFQKDQSRPRTKDQKEESAQITTLLSVLPKEETAPYRSEILSMRRGRLCHQYIDGLETILQAHHVDVLYEATRRGYPLIVHRLLSLTDPDERPTKLNEGGREDRVSGSYSYPSDDSRSSDDSDDYSILNVNEYNRREVYRPPLIHVVLDRLIDVVTRNVDLEEMYDIEVRFSGPEAYVHLLKVLLDFGADATLADKSHLSDTPLHKACYIQGDRGVHVAHLLLDQTNANKGNRPSLEVKNKDGATPLHLCAERNAELVDLLIRENADVVARDRRGNTPLHIAAFRMALRSTYRPTMSIGDVDLDRIFDSLVAAGADVDAKNNDGDTPIDIRARHLDRVEWRTRLV